MYLKLYKYDKQCEAVDDGNEGATSRNKRNFKPKVEHG